MGSGSSKPASPQKRKSRAKRFSTAIGKVFRLKKGRKGHSKNADSPTNGATDINDDEYEASGEGSPGSGRSSNMNPVFDGRFAAYSDASSLDETVYMDAMEDFSPEEVEVSDEGSSSAAQRSYVSPFIVEGKPPLEGRPASGSVPAVKRPHRRRSQSELHNGGSGGVPRHSPPRVHRRSIFDMFSSTDERRGSGSDSSIRRSPQGNRRWTESIKLPSYTSFEEMMKNMRLSTTSKDGGRHGSVDDGRPRAGSTDMSRSSISEEDDDGYKTPTARFNAGSSLERVADIDEALVFREGGVHRDASDVSGAASSSRRELWDEPKASNFGIRSKNYMKDKKKVDSAGPPPYALVALDLFSSDTKQSHIMQRIKLPLLPDGCTTERGIKGVKPWLIINFQIPTTNPSMFGGPADGTGYSLIYYFALRPKEGISEAVINLLRRFAEDGHEKDGERTRDRLKTIPKVANVEEAMTTILKGSAEKNAMKGYNGKPVMMKPQLQWYLGDDYLELDVDIHLWAFIARKALYMFLPRLDKFVFDIAFILQGNCPEELPEIVMACARLYRINFSGCQHLPDA